MMALWHAQVDSDAVEAGARLTVSSPHHVVRMVTADQLSIETRNGQRLAALVLDRTGGQMTLSMLDGRAADLEIATDDSVVPGIRPSSQAWRIDRVH
jgi:hypothetical protein